jgi:hypothetical protein
MCNQLDFLSRAYELEIKMFKKIVTLVAQVVVVVTVVAFVMDAVETAEQEAFAAMLRKQ